MLSLDKCSIQEILLTDIENLLYCEMSEERKWRVELVELILMEREQEGLDEDDLELLDWLCTNLFRITSLSLSSNNVF